MKFQKISHLIESKVLEGNINKEFIDSIMVNYDNIVESIDDDVPIHICNRIYIQYSTKKHMPTILHNGERKSSISSFYYSPKASSRLKRLSAILLPTPPEPVKFFNSLENETPTKDGASSSKESSPKKGDTSA